MLPVLSELTTEWNEKILTMQHAQNTKEGRGHLA